MISHYHFDIKSLPFDMALSFNMIQPESGGNGVLYPSAR